MQIINFYLKNYSYFDNLIVESDKFEFWTFSLKILRSASWVIRLITKSIFFMV